MLLGHCRLDPGSPARSGQQHTGQVISPPRPSEKQLHLLYDEKVPGLRDMCGSQLYERGCISFSSARLENRAVPCSARQISERFHRAPCPRRRAPVGIPPGTPLVLTPMAPTEHQQQQQRQTTPRSNPGTNRDCQTLPLHKRKAQRPRSSLGAPGATTTCTRHHQQYSQTSTRRFTW